MPATTAPGLEADILAPLWLEPEQSSQVFEIGTGILDLVGASAVPTGSPADFKPQHCANTSKSVELSCLYNAKQDTINHVSVN